MNRIQIQLQEHRKGKRNRVHLYLWFYSLEADPVAVIRTNVRCWRNAEHRTHERRPEKIDGNTVT